MALNISVVRDAVQQRRLLKVGTTCTAGAKYKEAKFQGFKILLQGPNTDLAMPVKKKVSVFTEESTKCFLAAWPMGVRTRFSLDTTLPFPEWLNVQQQLAAQPAAWGGTHAWGDEGDGVRFH